MPVRQRFASVPATSRSLVVAATLPPSPSERAPPTRRALPPAAAGAFDTTSSTSVFQLPHVSQRPAHFG
jgi:hypothetical protein